MLAALFGIESPKSKMDGSEVGNVYWKEKNVEKIVMYCQNDTLTIAQLLLAYQGKPLLESNQIEIAKSE